MDKMVSRAACGPRAVVCPALGYAIHCIFTTRQLLHEFSHMFNIESEFSNANEIIFMQQLTSSKDTRRRYSHMFNIESELSNANEIMSTTAADY